jgi:hypothetical protein
MHPREMAPNVEADVNATPPLSSESVSVTDSATDSDTVLATTVGELVRTDSHLASRRGHTIRGPLDRPLL